MRRTVYNLLTVVSAAFTALAICAACSGGNPIWYCMLATILSVVAVMVRP